MVTLKRTAARTPGHRALFHSFRRRANTHQGGRAASGCLVRMNFYMNRRVKNFPVAEDGRKPQLNSCSLANASHWRLGSIYSHNTIARIAERAKKNNFQFFPTFLLKKWKKEYSSKYSDFSAKTELLALQEQTCITRIRTLRGVAKWRRPSPRCGHLAACVRNRPGRVGKNLEKVGKSLQRWRTLTEIEIRMGMSIGTVHLTQFGRLLVCLVQWIQGFLGSSLELHKGWSKRPLWFKKNSQKVPVTHRIIPVSERLNEHLRSDPHFWTRTPSNSLVPAPESFKLKPTGVFEQSANHTGYDQDSQLSLKVG